MEENETKTHFYASIIQGRMLFLFSFNEELLKRIEHTKLCINKYVISYLCC